MSLVKEILLSLTYMWEKIESINRFLWSSWLLHTCARIFDSSLEFTGWSILTTSSYSLRALPSCPLAIDPLYFQCVHCHPGYHHIAPWHLSYFHCHLHHHISQLTKSPSQSPWSPLDDWWSLWWCRNSPLGIRLHIHMQSHIHANHRL